MCYIFFFTSLLKYVWWVFIISTHWKCLVQYLNVYFRREIRKNKYFSLFLSVGHFTQLNYSLLFLIRMQWGERDIKGSWKMGNITCISRRGHIRHDILLLLFVCFFFSYCMHFFLPNTKLSKWKRPYDKCNQRWFRSACASTKSYRSLSWLLTKCISLMHCILPAGSVDHDQTALTRRLIRVYACRICHKVVFHLEMHTSRKHAYIMLTPLNPTFI